MLPRHRRNEWGVPRGDAGANQRKTKEASSSIWISFFELVALYFVTRLDRFKLQLLSPSSRNSCIVLLCSSQIFLDVVHSRFLLLNKTSQISDRFVQFRVLRVVVGRKDFWRLSKVNLRGESKIEANKGLTEVDGEAEFKTARTDLVLRQFDLKSFDQLSDLFLAGRR